MAAGFSRLSLPVRAWTVDLASQSCDGRAIRSKRFGGTLAIPPGKIRLDMALMPLAIPPGEIRLDMALTRDDTLLVVSHGAQLTLFDVDRLKSGQGDAQLGQFKGPGIAGSLGVVITPDDRYALATQTVTGRVALIDLQRSRAAAFDSGALAEMSPAVPAGNHLVLSPDGQHLYTTTQNKPDGFDGPLTCLGGNRYERAIQVFGVMRARSDSTSAPIGFGFPAGCQPWGITVSPDGTRVSVTSGGDPAPGPDDGGLVVFDTKPIRDGKPLKLIGRIKMPGNPVDVVDTGGQLIIGFLRQDSARPPVVIDPSKTTLGEAAIVGSFPVYVGSPRLSADRRTLFGFGKLYYTDGAASLVVIDLERLPQQLLPR